jgi:L-alanine-DL-glutamate epimerase-like enolase superfamily enzyme
LRPSASAAISEFRALSQLDLVRLHTDTGLIGIGESYPTQEAHIGALREVAPLILGKDPTSIDRLWQDIFYRISYQPWGGAEFRMLTAINIAQWDILGKASGLPVYKLLGGKSQAKLVYNTMNGWPINGMREHDYRRKLPSSSSSAASRPLSCTRTTAAQSMPSPVTVAPSLLMLN